MVNKQLIMNSFKLKALNMMYPENRVMLGVTCENHNSWHKGVLPEELKKMIDKVYRNLSEIAQDNNISTNTINQLIEGKGVETNIEAQGLYKKKTIEQMNKLQLEFLKIKEARLISARINKELENMNVEINKSERERFMEGVKVENTPEIPRNFFEKQEENKNEKKYVLDPNVIE